MSGTGVDVSWAFVMQSVVALDHYLVFFYLHILHFIRKQNEPDLPLPSLLQLVLIYQHGGMES